LSRTEPIQNVKVEPIPSKEPLRFQNRPEIYSVSTETESILSPPPPPPMKKYSPEELKAQESKYNLQSQLLSDIPKKAEERRLRLKKIEQEQLKKVMEISDMEDAERFMNKANKEIEKTQQLYKPNDIFARRDEFPDKETTEESIETINESEMKSKIAPGFTFSKLTKSQEKKK